MRSLVALISGSVYTFMMLDPYRFITERFLFSYITFHVNSLFPLNRHCCNTKNYANFVGRFLEILPVYVSFISGFKTVLLSGLSGGQGEAGGEDQQHRDQDREGRPLPSRRKGSSQLRYKKLWFISIVVRILCVPYIVTHYCRPTNITICIWDTPYFISILRKKGFWTMTLVGKPEKSYFLVAWGRGLRALSLRNLEKITFFEALFKLF